MGNILGPKLKNKMAAVGEEFEKQDGVVDGNSYGFENKMALAFDFC